MELKLTAGDIVRVAKGCIAKVVGEFVAVRKEEDFKDGNIVRRRRLIGENYFYIDAPSGTI